MTIRHISIFIAVYQTGSVTRAAEKLYLSQPAVTRAIKELESYYNVVLFERIRNRLSVTEAGKRFYTYALHIADAFRRCETELRAWDDKGVIRVGASATIGSVLLPKAIRAFKEAHPDSDVRAVVANGETLTGAGILCLELCGKHLDPASLKAAEYLKREYDGKRVPSGNVHYGLYYTAQGLFQLGGEYWKSFEKWMHSEFLRRQRPDGSWCGQGDEGNPVYATAMTVLAFTVPYRMLPIYQRDETVDDDQEGKEK